MNLVKSPRLMVQPAAVFQIPLILRRWGLDRRAENPSKWLSPAMLLPFAFRFSVVVTPILKLRSGERRPRPFTIPYSTAPPPLLCDSAQLVLSEWLPAIQTNTFRYACSLNVRAGDPWPIIPSNAASPKQIGLTNLANNDCGNVVSVFSGRFSVSLRYCSLPIWFACRCKTGRSRDV